jgi:hypothetical protein
LRDKGWFVKLSLDREAGGLAVLNALKSYVTRLTEQYGKKAFRHFSSADMRVLGED